MARVLPSGEKDSQLVCSSVLHPASIATVVRSKDGQVVTTDGPFAETKEQLAGFWVIQSPDLDAALAWAAKGSEACGGPVEVRPFQEDLEA
ncbi:MAG: YciI family protein [Acidimicrobiales bacterium]